MRVLFLKWWSDVRSSYWFLPALLSALSIAAAILTLWIDHRFAWRVPEGVLGLESNQPDGARSLLATLAGSMITVAGLTFSMTLLAVSHASIQFGPRLLSNFMRNRGNQIVLGVYVSTFLYCLVVLRAIRAAGPAAAGDIAVEAFVPRLSITVAMGLAVVDVAFLIYYIHHVAESIRLSSILASVGNQLHESIRTLFPSHIGTPPSDEEITPTEDADEAIRHALHRQPTLIPSSSAGFIQRLDEDGLMSVAVDRNLVVELLHRPGEFVAKGQPLLRAGPSDRIDKRTHRKLEGIYATGAHRTPDQSASFLADQLAEVAIRALSPGVNDPRTAIDCLHWLSSVLYACRDRKDTSPKRYDGEGKLRVLSPVVTYETLCEIALEQTRPYFASDANAALAMMSKIRWLSECETSPSRQQLLRHYANRLYQTASEGGLHEIELERLKEARPD